MSDRSLLLDTNVLSQVLRTDGDGIVRDFIERCDVDLLRVSVVSIGEVQKGLSMLPGGRRRRDLEAWFVTLREEFSSRVVPIGMQTAILWGDLSARMRSIGQNIAVADLLIAATALEHDLTVVTRNVRDFVPTGVSVLDPWNPPAEPAATTTATDVPEP